MSGIGAIFARGGAPASQDKLKRMDGALRLHGSVRQNRWNSDSFGLCRAQSGHYTPQDSRDLQPLVDGERWAMVFSGRLDHREELADILGVDPIMAERLPDARLALLAWQKWQSGACEKLYGNFALIIVDRSEGLLFAFRSAIASLPLFYNFDSHRLAIGSAPKAIFALGDMPREVDEQRIADSLVQNNQDLERSFYRGIKSLPLGCLLIATGDRIKIQGMVSFENVPDVRFANDGDYVEAAEELLDRAIASSMRSQKLPAAMLSSGLDSSTVAVSALKYMSGHPEWSGRKLSTFTSVPDPEWDGITEDSPRHGDESGPVRAMAAMYPMLDANFIDCAGQSFDADLDLLTSLAEGPIFAVKNLHWMLGINRASKAAGHDVLLSGVGGNASLTGSGRTLPAKQFRELQWGALGASLKNMNNGRSFAGNFISQAVRPNMPRRMIDSFDAMKGRLGAAEWNEHIPINGTYAEDMDLAERRSQLVRGGQLKGRLSPRDELLQIAFGGMRDVSQSGRAAMESLTGVQTRDPLGDRKLFEFCFGLPAEQFAQNGMTRRLIKRMMKDKLPAEYFTNARGRQAADWHVRLTRELPNIRREVDRLADDDDMKRRFDIPRIQKLLDSWPDKTPISTADHPDYLLARMGLGRTLNTARFINWVKGKN